MAADPIPATVLVGEDVELDLKAHRILRAGQTVKLERIPMEILLLLVERRGALVTRQEIIARVWGADTFLDTDNSINGAVRKIRHVLKDNTEAPRFIETVTGKGYRFIGVIHARPPLVPPAGPTDEYGAVPTGRARARWIAAVAVALLVLAAWMWFKETIGPERRMMLAVLPFDNLTGDPAQLYFSEGLTEELIGRLGNLETERLGVIARASVAHYRTKPSPLSELRSDLGVHYVLQGSVRRDGDRVRITAQLIHAREETPLWSRNYDRQVHDLLAVQDDIAQAVADEIQLTLEASSRREQAGPLSREEYDAYDLYLRGRYLWNKRTVAALEQAAGYFQQAIDRYPGYARAYAGLAESYALMSGYSGRPSVEVIPRARDAARQALRLNPSLAEAHTALAVIAQNYDWDWATAENAYRRALVLDPTHATARHWYAEFLAFQGRFEEAAVQIERARRVDPLSLIIRTDHVAMLLYARQYERARQELSAVLEMEPDFPRARGLLVWLNAHTGLFTEALSELDTWPDGFWRAAMRAYVLGRAGRSHEARESLDRLRVLYRQERYDAAPMVVARIGVGHLEDAFQWLDRAVRERSPELAAIKVHPLYDPLRTDPRFEAVLARVGLNEPR